MAHEPDHEDLLQQMLAGDSAPNVRAHVASCPACAPRWRELQSLAASIDAADRERRDVLAQSAEPRSAPGSDRVRATLEAQRGLTFASAQRKRMPLLPRRAWMLAAAVLVAGLFVVRALVPGHVVPDTPMGAEIEFETTYTTLSDGVPIRWRFGGETDRVFFHVQLRGASEAGEARSEDIPVREAGWTPDAKQLSGLRGTVRLWVEAFDRPVHGELLGTSRVITPSVSH